MKIIYLHQYFRINSGGTRSYEFAKELSKNGLQVDVITGTKVNNSCLKNNNICLHSTNTNYSNKMSKWRRILAFLDYCIKSLFIGLKIKDVDVIFATSTPLTVGLPAVLISKMRNKKLIFEVRDVWPDIPIELGYINNKFIIKLLKEFELWIYRNSSHIIVLSEGMYENLVKKGVKESKITIIENLSNLYLYDSILDVGKEDYLKNKFVCIHPGAMGHVNGLDFILDVAKEIIKIDKDIVFLLIGDGNRKKHLKNRVICENLTNVIIKDSLPKKEIVKVIKSSDLGIVCVDNRYKILEDNSANKFFDYLAAGIPVLINYAGWQKKTIEKANCGKSVLEPSAMARTIIKLKNNPDLRKKMGRNARILAEKRFSDTIAKKKLLKIINNVLRDD